MARTRKRFSVVPSPDLNSAKGLERISLFNPDGSAFSGGGSPIKKFEVSNLVIPNGADWSMNGHVLGTIEYEGDLNPPIYRIVLKIADSLPIGGDYFEITMGTCSDPEDAYNTMGNDGLYGNISTDNGLATYGYAYGPTANRGAVQSENDFLPEEKTVVIATSGPAPEEVVITSAYCSILVL